LETLLHLLSKVVAMNKPMVLVAVVMLVGCGGQVLDPETRFSHEDAGSRQDAAYEAEPAEDGGVLEAAPDVYEAAQEDAGPPACVPLYQACDREGGVPCCPDTACSTSSICEPPPACTRTRGQACIPNTDRCCVDGLSCVPSDAGTTGYACN
jgi:hypothetical protein